jgi:hypothetical protein
MTQKTEPNRTPTLQWSEPLRRLGGMAAVAVLVWGGVAAVAAETDRQYCERQQGAAREVCLRELDKMAPPPASAAAPAMSEDRAYCEAQHGSAREVCLSQLDRAEAAAPAAATAKPALSEDRAYCEAQHGSAREVCLSQLERAKAAAPAAATAKPALSEDRAYCEAQHGSAREVCLSQLDRARPAAPVAATATPAPAPAAPAVQSGGAGAPAAYKVKDGVFVDAHTYEGFKTWRAAACDRCHGPNQEGLVGPSLVDSLKVLTRANFVKTVTEGRLAKGMPSFATNPTVTEHIDALYDYLKGRSDGAITQGKVKLMAGG